MASEFLSAYRFQLGNEFGPENGALFVQPVAAIPQDKRDSSVGEIYAQTVNEIAASLPAYRYYQPKPKREESVYGFIKLFNAGGGITDSIVGHAVGSHEKIGGRFKGRSVANLDSIFVKRFAEEIDDHTTLRNLGIGEGLGYALLGSFDPDQTVTVMDVPMLGSEEDASKVHETLLSLDFVERKRGKTSRHNDRSNNVWYEGPTAGEIKAQLFSENPMIEECLPYYIKSVETQTGSLLRGLGKPGKYLPVDFR